MARTINKLSAVKINAFKSRGRHGDGGGLWLNVSKNGSKSWVFRWTRDAVTREMGLGPFPEISLALAREKAFECRQQVALGKDPLVERGQRGGATFGNVADEYLDSMSSRWTNAKTRWQWENSLNKACASIRNREINSLQTQDVLLILKPIWKKTPETASRVRMRMESVLDYANARGIRSGDNPARWKGHLENILPKRDKSTRVHHPALPYEEMPAFLVRLQNAEALSARALELLILTAVRTSEVREATWNEINLSEATWIIPAARMKAKKEHRIPLSDMAVELLQGLSETRTSEFVFPGQRPGKPLSSHSMEMLLRRLKAKDCTVHGFRSSFRDWCGDKTSFPREVAEAALAHKVGSEVEQAYRRSDAFEKRRQLMQLWADYCRGTEIEKVVNLYA